MNSILSLNCYDISLFTFSQRMARMRHLIAEVLRLRPTILCLQEVMFPDTVGLFTTALREAGYSVFPEKATKLIQDGGLLTASLLPVVSAAFERYEEQGAFLGLDIFERMTSKGFHTVRIRSGAAVYTIVNTHLHCPFGAYSSTKRFRIVQNQMDQCLRGQDMKKRFILTGDLNVIPGNETLTDLRKLLADPFAGKRAVTIDHDNTHRKYAPRFRDRIDYILMSKDMAPKKPRVVFTDPVTLHTGVRHHLSDHFGVLTYF